MNCGHTPFKDLRGWTAGLSGGKWKCCWMESIVFAATLGVRGNTSLALQRACNSSGVRQFGVRLVKWLEDEELQPSYALSISSGKIRIRLDNFVTELKLCNYNTCPTIRFNFVDGTYLEISGFEGDEDRGQAAKWLNSCKHAVACAVCSKSFKPIAVEGENICRISEKSICRVISKLSAMVSTEDPLLTQAKFLLKSRQAPY